MCTTIFSPSYCGMPGYSVCAEGVYSQALACIKDAIASPDGDELACRDRVDADLVPCKHAACDAYCREQGFPGGRAARRADMPAWEFCNCAPAKAPIPAQAKIELAPNSGPPETEVDVQGEGFDADEDVELRWDETTGDRLTRVRADSTGRFLTRIVVPAGATVGPHQVVAVSPRGRRASAPFEVEVLQVHGLVRARLRGGLPLQGVEVTLFWQDPAGNNRNLGHALTDEKGRYVIPSPRLRVPMSGSLLLRVTLREDQFGTFTLFDGKIENRLVTALFGRDGLIGARPDDTTTWFVIRTDADLEKNLWFENLDDDPSTTTIREDHALDSAVIYYHTHQAMRFFRQLGAPFSRVPVGVVVFSARDTSCSGQRIDINGDDSAWDVRDAPVNREWHEFAHYVMWDLYGGSFPPWHYEADDMNGNRQIDSDENHGGYWGNWLSSSDAIIEGFAIFMAMAIADEMKQRGEPYNGDHLEPYIYPISTGRLYPALYNLEVNQPQTLYHWLPAALSGRSIPDEELAVASLLWDLYDGKNEDERDQVQLSLLDIWRVWSRTYTFPQYYDGEQITQFTGDHHTYAGRWLSNSYVGERSLAQNRLFPTMTRHIWYIKDLYDALVLSFPDEKRSIDVLFVNHDILVDTFAIFEDYALLGTQDVTTFGDNTSRVEVSVSAEAAYDFWGKGIVADLEVSGWGGGFTVQKTAPYDARGYLYLLMWVNAPPGTGFQIVVEDHQGQWLASGISTALFDLAQTPTDLTLFQQGTGTWGAYQPPLSEGGPYPFAAVLFSHAGGPGPTATYRFRPNPHYKTPAAGALAPDPRTLRGIGVLFTTPGQYRAKVGAMVLVLDYPWVMGLRSIKGIGDSSQGRFRPYRRSVPPIPGSLARVTVNEVPATVHISVQYPAPYRQLSFAYSLTMVRPSEEFWLYLDPPIAGADSVVTMVARKEGFTDSEPLSISSSQFWEDLGRTRYVVEANLNLKPGWRGIGLTWVVVGGGGLLLVLVSTLAIVYYPRRRQTESSLCPSCGGPILPGSKTCRQCGPASEQGREKPASPSRQKRCRTCGTLVGPGDRYCSQCGSAMRR